MKWVKAHHHNKIGYQQPTAVPSSWPPEPPLRRTYLLYLLAVVLPAALAAAGGAALADRALRELRRDSQRHVAGMALKALEEDAAEGLLPSTAQVGRASGYRTALYADGRREAATEPPPGPETLAPELLAASSSPGGTTLRVPGTGGTEAVLVSGPGRRGSAGTYTVLVAPADPVGTLLPLPLVPVAGLLFLFASLAGWIQLAGTHGGRAASFLLLSAVPALTAWGLLVESDRLYRHAESEAERRDLSRALAVARLRDVEGEPERVHALTGFHAWRVRGGSVVSASLEGPAGAVAALPAPPPSFTSTGTVATPEGEAAYVALRLPDGGFTVAAARPSPERAHRFRNGAIRAAAALAGWLLLVGVAAGARHRPAS